MNKKNYKYLNNTLFVLIFLLFISYFWYPLVDSDSGYFLSIAKEVYRGKIYFKEIATIYNPLAIVTLGLPYVFSETADVRLCLLLNLFFIFGSTIIFYSILSIINKNKQQKIFFAMLFLLITLMLDGNSLMLEPISVFFQLSSLLIYMKFKECQNLILLFIAGICAGLSFIAKQYGIFIVAALLIDLSLIYQNKIRNSFVLIIGLCLPISILFLYLINNDCTFFQCIKYISGQSASVEIGSGTGSNYTLFTYCIGFMIFVLFNFYIIFIPTLFLNVRDKLNKKNYIFLLAVILSLSIFLFASYLHYFQYIVPYMLLLYVLLDSNTDNVFHKKAKIYVYLFSISIIMLTLGYSFLRKESKYIQQKKSAAQLSTLIPKKSAVFLDGISPAFYFLNDLKSINLSKIGFSYPGCFYPKTIIANMKPNSYLVLNKQSLKKYDIFLEQFSIYKAQINGETIFICRKN